MGITALFDRLGAPLINPRRSWGGVRRDGSVVLRVWQNEAKRINRISCIQLTHHAEFAGREGDTGHQERLAHVARIQFGARCDMVMCEPKDPNGIPREIKGFNQRELFVAGEIFEYEGDWWAPIVARQPVH